MNLFPSFVVDKRKFYAKNSTHLFLVVPNPGIRVNSNYAPTLLIGLCLGITLGVALIPLFEIDCQPTFVTSHNVNNFQNNFQNSAAEASVQSSRSSKNMLRPRFYSTELGLRKKLVAGIILTDYNRLENLVAINKTLGSFVNQIIFFVVGQEASKKVRSLGLGAVVTLTSKRNNDTVLSSLGNKFKLKLNSTQSSQIGLRAIKYLGEKLADDYDFFYLSLDNYYTNGIRLQEFLNRVSVSFDVFWGAKSGINDEMCGLETGLVFSRSILRKFSARLDRCLVSSVLQHSNPMRSCYAFALGLECSATLTTSTYPTENFSMFEPAVSIGPLTSASEIYGIHLMISEKRVEKIDEKITNLSGIMDSMLLQLPEDYQINSWPIGIPIQHRPQGRFDVLKWKFFTRSNLYPKNDHEAEMILSNGGIEQMDISSVINDSLIFLARIHDQNSDSFHFQYGYRRFDEARGMEYILDFLNTEGTLLRVENLRPISNVEMVPIPFVAEVRRVTIVVPITSLDLYNQTDSFIRNYLKSVDKNSNSVLVFAIVLPDSGNLSMSELRKLQTFKRMILQHNSDLSGSSQVTDSNIKVGHVIVNLRQFKASHYMFAIFDMLSNHILSPNTLVLAADLFVEIKEEFLNRVRMNTILNYQVFSPMPFVEYDPKIYGRDENSNAQLDMNKSTGYWIDQNSFNFVSFYIGDYLAARKQSNLSRRSPKSSTSFGDGNGLSRLFLSQSKLDGSSSPHFLLAPEPTLRVRFSDNFLHPNCSQNDGCVKRKLGSKAELAKLILQTTPL